ncbi:MAG: NUDIX hydrolase [Armatimonadota bacterium]
MTFDLEVSSDFLEYLKSHYESDGPLSEVVMVLPRPHDRVLLVTKAFYPRSVYRLPSGKLKSGESPDDAFVRESFEETGLDLHPVFTIGTVVLRCWSASDVVEVLSHILLGTVTSEEPRAVDMDENISGFCEVHVSELRVVAERLNSLQGLWRDWGMFRSPAHTVVADYFERTV